MRWRFNCDNSGLASGESLLMERLAIEAELEEVREAKRARQLKRQQEEQIKRKDLNDNQNTVHHHTTHSSTTHLHHQPMDEIDENDHAVKGLLDAF